MVAATRAVMVGMALVMVMVVGTALAATAATESTSISTRGTAAAGATRGTSTSDAHACTGAQQVRLRWQTGSAHWVVKASPVSSYDATTPSMRNVLGNKNNAVSSRVAVELDKNMLAE